MFWRLNVVTNSRSGILIIKNPFIDLFTLSITELDLVYHKDLLFLFFPHWIGAKTVHMLEPAQVYEFYTISFFESKS